MFQQMLNKGRELIAPMRSKMTLTELVSVVSKIPLVGKPTVKALASRSSQRHKCNRCGTIFEVTVSRIMECPFAVLADNGRERLAAIEKSALSCQGSEATSTVDAVAPTSSGTQHTLSVDNSQVASSTNGEAASSLQTPGADVAQPDGCITMNVIESTAGSAPCCATAIVTAPPDPEVPNHEQTSTDPGALPASEGVRTQDNVEVVPVVAAEPATQASATDNAAPSAVATVDPASPHASSAHDRFPCPKCGGRLGVNCFAGDATNGDKQVLLDRLLALFRAMPEVLALEMRPETVHAIEVNDVYWVD